MAYPEMIERESGISTDERRWWRQRWRPILTGYVLTFVIGMLCASATKSFGDWNKGYAWERDMIIRIHTPLPWVLDKLMMICPWFGTNISLIPAMALICWWLAAKRHKPRLAMRLGIVQIGSYLLNPSLKALYDRARPSSPRRMPPPSFNTTPTSLKNSGCLSSK